MVGQDFFSPSDDRVHDFAVFGDLACRVEVGEPSERLVGAVEVFGFAGAGRGLLESVPSSTEAGVSFEQPIQMLVVPFCEVIRPPQEG